jgi:hypothetical protein
VSRKNDMLSPEINLKSRLEVDFYFGDLSDRMGVVARSRAFALSVVG